MTWAPVLVGAFVFLTGFTVGANTMKATRNQIRRDVDRMEEILREWNERFRPS
jgi:hypothetical protein